jgi:hypothetical protein
MRTGPMSTRCVVGGLLLGLLVAMGPLSATALSSPPTASVSPGQASFTAGAPAMFKGRGFSPGEQVTF